MKTIKEIREAKGISSYRLAKRLKKSPQYLHNIEKSGSVSLKRFAEICIALEYSEFETIQFISENLVLV